MGVNMKHTKTQNVIRLVATLALAISFTQASPFAQHGVGEPDAQATQAGIDVLQPDAVAGGQASNVDLYICAALVLMSPFFPVAIIPAIPVCYNAYTGTLG